MDGQCLKREIVAALRRLFVRAQQCLLHLVLAVPVRTCESGAKPRPIPLRVPER
jgi:hypothetical protein